MNSVQLVGRLTKDPVLTRIASQEGRPVCEMRIAVNGAREGQTTYVDVVSFDRAAEACAEHLAKGRQVAVEGRLVYREWQAPDGSKRSKHSVLGRVEFLGAPNGQGGSAAQSPPEQGERAGEEVGRF